MTISETLTAVISPINTWVWYAAFVFLIGGGLVFLFKLKGLQILKIRQCAKLALTGTKDGANERTVSSFEAFCIGLGARVGVGNIAGVGGAIVLGGPGAIFWMWIFAIIGAGTSFMETTLAQLFKEKKDDGSYYGGPAFYAMKGVGSKKLAYLISILTIITFGIGFVGVQAATSASALSGAFDFEYNTIIFGALITIAAAAIIFGGVKRIAVFSAKVVPVMAFVWLIVAGLIIVTNYDQIWNAAKMIFTYAFTLESAIGGAIGAAIMNGLKRGVFSNEAGLGSIANIAGTADVKHPVKQGMIQSFGTLIDTLVVCSFTAFAILTTYGSYEGVLATGLTKDILVQDVFSIAYGDVGPTIVALFMLVFAFTSLIGYYTMSESSMRFMTDKKSTVFAVRVLVCIVAFVSCLAGTGLMELICDTFMAFMGCVNVITIFLLAKLVYIALDDWNKQKASGIEEPVFNREIFGDEPKAQGITEWDGTQ